MGGWIGLGVAVMALLWLAVTYNRLVAHRNKVAEAWSGIDVQLTRRAELVPNLVETVRGYRVHEQDVLTSVTEARAAVVAAEGARASGVADDRLEQALGRLYVVAEAYPDLRASELFGRLQSELTTLEEDISFARRYHNAVVERLNTAIQRIPTVLVARPLGFTAAEFFKADAAHRAVPSARIE
jgi:LemA protein